MSEKYCSKCRQFLPLAQFTKDRGKKDGFRTVCTPCTRAKDKLARRAFTAPLNLSEKYCPKCNSTKPVSAFHKRKAGDGYRAVCRECVKPSRQRHRALNRLRLNAYSASRWHWEGLKTRFGLTLDQYKAMVALQDGKCLICHQPPMRIGKRNKLYVDHCHQSRKIRGLLCNSCNAAIGNFRDDPCLIEKAINYLRQPLSGLAIARKGSVERRRQREEILNQQCGKCAICANANHGGRNFHLDHCHLTYFVRSVTCHNCNLGLGHFKDDTVRMQSAIAYLNQHAP